MHGSQATDWFGLNAARIAAMLTILASAYVIFTGLGVGLRHIFQTYLYDEWVWLDDVRRFGWWRASVCNHFGHADVLPNLHLAFNYYFLDASVTGRALVTMAVHLAGSVIVARLALSGLQLTRLTRLAVYFACAAFALSSAMGIKLWWSFGLTDGLAFLGAEIAALGILSLSGGRYPALGIFAVFAGSAISTFSFGTGLSVWIAMLFSMWFLNIDRRFMAIYVLAAVATIYVAMFALPSCTAATGTGLDAGVNNTTHPGDPIGVVRLALATLGFVPGHALFTHVKLGRLDLHIWWMLVGLAVLLAAGAIALRVVRGVEKDRIIIALLSIMAVPAGGAMLVGISRLSEFGLAASYFPRYGAMVTPFWMCLCAVIWRLMLRRNSQQMLTAAMAMTLTTSLFFAACNRYVSHGDSNPGRLMMAAIGILVDADPQNKAVKSHHATVGFVHRGVAYMKQGGVGLFGSGMARATDGIGKTPIPELTGKCTGYLRALDSYDTEGASAFAGWAVDPPGAKILWLEAYKDGVLTGVGTRGTTVLGSTPGSYNASPLAIRLGMYFPAVRRTFAISPGYVGMTRGLHASEQDTTWVCVLSNGQHARLGLPSRAGAAPNAAKDDEAR